MVLRIHNWHYWPIFSLVSSAALFQLNFAVQTLFTVLSSSLVRLQILNFVFGFISFSFFCFIFRNRHILTLSPFEYFSFTKHFGSSDFRSIFLSPNHLWSRVWVFLFTCSIKGPHGHLNNIIHLYRSGLWRCAKSKVHMNE